MVDIIRRVHHCRKVGSHWEFQFDRKNVFNKVSELSVFYNNRLPETQRANYREIFEGDISMFNNFFTQAIADVVRLTARYYKDWCCCAEVFSPANNIEDDSIFIRMELPKDHSDSMAFVLDIFLHEYIELAILKKWYGIESVAVGIDQDIEDCLKKINEGIHFRERPIRRKIDPLF